ncbi:MAG: bifunctional pyr operon transcriptional regulator/uracil phosphoribosyltransferase PyrR [Dehalococcoidia bacterium]
MIDSVIMSSGEISRCLSRIAHELIEQHQDLRELLLVGIRTRGVPLANRVASTISELDGVNIPVGTLDIRLYRDDLTTVAQWPLVLNTEIPVGVADKKVVLFDDVLFTGRTVRAALDALTHLGRPKRVQLAVLVDRGHRELPIRADYVGRNIPTSLSEIVKVCLTETDGREEVLLRQKDREPVRDSGV